MHMNFIKTVVVITFLKKTRSHKNNDEFYIQQKIYSYTYKVTFRQNEMMWHIIIEIVYFPYIHLIYYDNMTFITRSIMTFSKEIMENILIKSLMIFYSMV